MKIDPGVKIPYDTRLLKKNEKKIGRPFNFMFRYIDDVISLNDCKFGDFVDRIHHIELEIKDTTDEARSASYPDLYYTPRINNEDRLRTSTFLIHDLSLAL